MYKKCLKECEENLIGRATLKYCSDPPTKINHCYNRGYLIPKIW